MDATPTKRFQFSTTDLAIAVLAVACGTWLSLVDAEYWTGYELTWFSSPLVVGNLFLAAVLWQEVTTIRVARLPSGGETQESRSALTLHLMWRYLLLLIVVVAQSAFISFAARATIDPELPRASYDPLEYGTWLIRGVAILPWVVSALLVKPPSNPSAFFRRTGCLLDWIAALCAIIVAILLVQNRVDIMVLIYAAVLPIECSASPTQYTSGGVYEGLNPLPLERKAWFIFVTYCGVIPIVISALLCCATVHRWQQGKTVRILFCLVVVGFGAMAMYPAWLYLGGLHAMSPPFADASLRLNLTSITCAVTLILLVSGYFAWKPFERSETVLTLGTSQVRRCCTVLFMFGLLGVCVEEYATIWRAIPWVVPGVLLTIYGVVAVLAVIRTPPNVTLRRPGLVGRQFWAVWLMLFCGIVFALPALTWLSYAVGWTLKRL